MELAGILSSILVCQSILCGYIHVAAAAAITSPGSSVSATLATATRSSSVASTSSGPIPNITTASSSALPTSSTPSIPVLPPGELPSSCPQNSTVTSGVNFDTSWQQFYLVTQGLPGITFPLGNNYAGNIPNGPMVLHSDFKISQNPRSLPNLIDTFWVDQPGRSISFTFGVGFSTADSTGYAKDENDVTADFIGFLSNLVKVFPSLATRPLYLAGEDYAGVYISYISKALLTTSNPPVVLQKIAIGNGLLQDISISTNLAITSIMESFPQLIQFDQSVFKAFQSKVHLCGYDVNLTYPQQSPLSPVQPSRRVSSLWTSVASRAQTTGLLQKRGGSLTNQLDPYYGCSLFDELVDYAANFSFPWSPGAFDLFDVTDVINPQLSIDGGVYFNSLQVRGALHAPFNKNWTSMDQYPFGSTLNFLNCCNRPATFFEDLASIAGSKDVEIVLYSSGNNAIAHHRSLEILIQNTTFGGTRGFTRKPSTAWVDDDGNVAGIVHQERGILYALFDDVGSLTPYTNPTAAYTLFREFVLNSNTTGSITVDSDGKPAVLGGEDPRAADDAPRIASEIFLGANATQSTLIAPSATIAAWQQFLVNDMGAPTDSAVSLPWPGRLWISTLCAVCFVLAL
ncbi:Alpha/Beta hydrolase protein [Lactifluus subvellereus]|nr:Alpha/Beta hydrolase protein [Lactifluus subvellereus]